MESERVPEWGARLQQVELTSQERRQVEAAVADPTLIQRWMPPVPDAPEAIGIFLSILRSFLLCSASRGCHLG